MSNRSLSEARSFPNDEFYTQYADVAEEIEAYVSYNPDVFRGKSVLCPCDESWSSFTKYFEDNFVRFGLRELVCTAYKKDRPRGMIYRVTSGGVFSGQLFGDGDFRSDEVTALKDAADVVITNPPFSLFREFLAWVFPKPFAVIGTINAITYKQVFPLLKNNQVWLGCRPLSKDLYFRVSRERQAWLVAVKTAGSAYKVVDGHVMGRLASACWFTMFDHARRHIPLPPGSAQYDPVRYPQYDNFNAIDVRRVADIPWDYLGVMGVPITFMDKYCPDQFELLGHEHDLCGNGGAGVPGGQFTVNGRGVYKRILIRRR